MKKILFTSALILPSVLWASLLLLQPPPFNPCQFGCLAIYDTTITANLTIASGRVSQFLDSSGFGHTAVQPTTFFQPTYVGTGEIGYPEISTDSAGFMTIIPSITGTGASNMLSVVAVGTLPSAGSTGAFILNSNGSLEFILNQSAAFNVIDVAATANSIFSTSPGTTIGMYVLDAGATPGTAQAWINKSPIALNTFTGTAWNGGTFNQFFKIGSGAKITWVGIFAAGMTQTQVNYLYNGLSAKYGHIF